jgi:hypothetical protein
MGARARRERLLVAGLGGLLAGYAGLVLALGRVSLGDYLALGFDYLRVAATVWSFTGCVAAGWLLWRERSAGGKRAPSELLADWFRRRWQADRWLSLAAPPLLFALLLTSFNSFKQRVLPQAGFGFDAPLAAIDRALFLGHDPWRITHGVFVSPWASWGLDLAYHAWFAPMAIGIMTCGFLPSHMDRLRYRYLISYVLLWLICGSLLALAMPSAGPCYQPTAIGGVAGFEPLMERLRAQHDWLIAHGMQGGLAALRYQDTLLALFGGSELTVGGGISAMPSMHNGLAVLFAVAAFQIHRAAGLALAAYAALIWIGSIHLGWHYAVDGPVAALVTIAVWRMSAPLADGLLKACPHRGYPAGPVLERS